MAVRDPVHPYPVHGQRPGAGSAQRREPAAASPQKPVLSQTSPADLDLTPQNAATGAPVPRTGAWPATQPPALKGPTLPLGACSRELHTSGISSARMLLKCTAIDAMNLTCKRNTIRLPWAPWSGPGSAGRIASDHSGDHLIPALLYDHDQDAAGNTTDNYKRMLASSSRALATTAQACHGLVAGSPRSGHDPAISARWAPGHLAPSGFSHSHGMWVRRSRWPLG